MSFNLLDVVKGHLSGDMISKAASFLGEDEGSVNKAMGGIVPTLLSGLASKAASSDGANEVAKMAGDAHSSGILGNIGSFFGGGDMLGKGLDLVKGLFGSKMGGVVDAISAVSGVKSSSTNSLLSMALPVALGALGKHSADNNLGAGGIASLLSSGSSSWSKLLPSGLGNLLSLGGVVSAVTGLAGGAADKAGSVVSSIGGHADDVVDSAKGGMKWLLPLLIVGALGFLAYWMLGKNGCGKKDGAAGYDESTSTSTAASGTANAGAAASMPKITVDTVTGVVNYDLGAAGDLELPGGVKLSGVAKDGFENTLVNFIKTGTIDTVNKKANWFNLHDVQFISGKTEYATPKAMAQIKNAAAILKAYPNVALKLGGYTDITGDPAKNKDLSDRRAKQVMKDLIASGATAAQIKEAVGYGSEFAEAKAGDKEGMARDRKTTAKVASK